MPLFRLHRSTYKESIKTTQIVNSIDHLRVIIMHEHLNWCLQAHERLNMNVMRKLADFDIKIEIPYKLDKLQSFDERCGWYTHYVSANLFEKDSYFMVGFLSEPLD